MPSSHDTSSSTSVAVSPPLPPISEPPRLPPDPRQGFFTGFSSALLGAVPDNARVHTINTVTGFPASAVDLGRLQTELQKGLRGFDYETMKARLGGDLGEWMIALVMAWVQRAKAIFLEKSEDSGYAIVDLRTEDDEGCYQYRFDVRPGIRADAED